MKRLTSAVLVLLLMTGCAKTPGSEPGPMHKWFNPHGQPAQDKVPPQCSKGELPVPADAPKPPRPPENKVPAGWNRATYVLRVDAVKVSVPTDRPTGRSIKIDYCIPVSLFVYITGAGQPVEVVEISERGVATHPVPWNALRDTPWQSTIDVYWDPKTTPPVMNFELSAKYEIRDGLSTAAEPTDGRVGLMCRIVQSGITLSMGMSLDIHAPTRQVDVLGATAEYVTGPFVKCRPPAFSALPQ